MPRHKKNKSTDKRELVLKSDDQEYARITRMLGNCRVMCYCYDIKERLGIIRGSMKRCRIKVDDIVLVAFRDYQDDKVDIIHCYKPEEIRILQQMHCIPQDVTPKTNDHNYLSTDVYDDVVFEYI